MPSGTVWADWVELFDRKGLTLHVFYAVIRTGAVVWRSDGAWLEERDADAAAAVRRAALNSMN